jgi:hypothetical protein
MPSLPFSGLMQDAFPEYRPNVHLLSCLLNILIAVVTFDVFANDMTQQQQQ